MNDVCAPATTETVMEIMVVTKGVNVEPRRAILRRATPVEKNAYGPNTKYMISHCPSCGEPIPVVPSKLHSTFIIATHGAYPPHGEIVCSYGGEPLDLQGNCPP